jgi:hypothetical protein
MSPEAREPAPKGRPTDDQAATKLLDAPNLRRTRDTGRQALRQLLHQIDVQEAMRRRAVQAAITEALAEYWLGRAAVFTQVGTPACDLVVENCLNHARLLAGEFGPVDQPWPGFCEDLDLVLAERGAA